MKFVNTTFIKDILIFTRKKSVMIDMRKQ